MATSGSIDYSYNRDQLIRGALELLIDFDPGESIPGK